jgi:peptide/nickel transport system substrate-binding protein
MTHGPCGDRIDPRLPRRRLTRSSNRRPGRPLALLLAGALALSACAEQPDRRRGGTVVIGAGSDLDFANPLVSVDAWTNEILRFALFAPLVRYGPALEIEPWLAESWDMEGDTAVVFRLRRDVAWHDGTPTTAHDVLFTFQRARDPATAFANSAYFAHWIDGEVVDSFTVRFRFEPHAEPLAGWPFTPVVPRHVLETVPPAELRNTPFNRSPVGNGPFRFVSQRTNDRWVFEANPDFPQGLGGPPLLDRLVWRVIPDNTAQITELRVGHVDLALQPHPDQVHELGGRDGFRMLSKPSRQFEFIAWNGQRPPLDDPRVRKALALAIDRDRILHGIRNGLGTPAVGPIMPFHWAHDPAIPPLPFDPDSALGLLRAAGIQDQSGDGRLQLTDGSPFQIEIKHPAGSSMARDVAEAIRGDLARIGIRAAARPTEATTLFADVTSPQRRFDAALLGWSGDIRLDLRDNFHSRAAGGPYQFASYANPEVDALLDRAALELDRDRATDLWRRVQNIFREEQPWTLLYYRTDAFLARDRLQGVDMDVRGTLLTLPAWWVEGRHDPYDADLDLESEAQQP